VKDPRAVSSIDRAPLIGVPTLPDSPSRLRSERWSTPNHASNFSSLFASMRVKCTAATRRRGERVGSRPSSLALKSV